jgi:hypothetical protein
MTEAEWRDWSAAQKACWEVTPLVELVDGRKVQVGFEFNVFAQFAKDVSGDEARKAAFPVLRAQLEALAGEVFPREEAVERFEIAPVESALRLRAEAEYAPEMLLLVRVFHRQEYFQPVGEDDRHRLSPLEDRLKAYGLKARSWGPG